MANKIGLITKWSVEMFDEAYVADARSSVLDANHGLLSFTGAKTVRFPKWSGDGLYNYQRANIMVDGEYINDNLADANFAPDLMKGTKGYGYQQGDATLEWEERTMRVQRAVQYRIDAFDDEETEHKAVAISTGQINKQKIIPEIDAYTFSQIVHEACSEAMGNLITRDGTEKPLHLLNMAKLFLADNEVEDGDMIAFISNRLNNELRESTEVAKWMRQEDFHKNVSFTIKEYEDIPLIPVPKRRFYTHVVLGPGYFGPGANSKAIDLLMVAKSSVYHVVKYNKIKVFSPEVVQDFNGYKVNALVYHDVFVPDNKKISCYCVLSAQTSDQVKADVVAQLYIDTTGGKLNNLILNPGATRYDSIVYAKRSSANTAVLPVGTTVDTTAGTGNATEIAVFGTLPTATGTYDIACVAGGKVIAMTTYVKA